MDRPPFFAFYPAVFTSDIHVEAMTTLQVGAYLLLLCKAWQADPPASLPNDDQILARFARVTPEVWAEAKAGVLVPFRLGTDGRLHSKRLRQEYDIALAKIRERSESGRKGAISRWGGRRNAVGGPKHGSAMAEPSAQLLTPQCAGNGIQKETKTLNPPLPPGGGSDIGGPPPLEEIAAVWNAVESLPAFGGTNPYIRRFFAEMWHDPSFRDSWKDVIAALGLSSYHRGENEDGFVATLSWAFSQKGYPKALANLEKHSALLIRKKPAGPRMVTPEMIERSCRVNAPPM